MTEAARPRASLYGHRHGVVTGHHLATRAACAQLERGGTLVDGMIAASAVLAVVLPHATSLGGCGMMLLHDAASGKTRALNGSGIAPARATPALFAQAIDARGPRSWVVPGLVRLWAQAHRAHGRQPWRTLFEDAIELAADGAAFSSEVARNLALVAPQVRAQAGFDTAFQVDGVDRRPGAPWRQRALADTLRHIALHGEAGFYEGPVARALCAFSAETGGLLQQEDLRRVAADWTEPVRQRYGKLEALVMPPNSVGVLMLAQLARLQGSFAAPRAQRLYAQVMNARACLPRLHDRVADDRAAWPWRDDALAAAVPGPVRGEPGDTAGIVLADHRGNGLVMLQSVFQPFGSGCVDPATGILMNNRLSEFSTDPARHNLLAPGRRPVHTLNPYMVFEDGRPALYAVSPGGVSQTTTAVQCISNVLLDHTPLPQALDLPRWSIGRDGQLMCEPGFPQETVGLLRDAGVRVVENSLHPFYFGSIKAVRYLDGMLEAAADLRRQACASAW
ncbi:Gamma-glutamyltransferase [Bordetella sputigena]|uniref:gamma-glutamyltransferase family protein n=1 Tax=Bordetella sputigena TaxID=1416810 RepID=UPI0039EF447A